MHSCFFFFFQAEDGIRDYKVTGVQTCALRSLGSDGGTGIALGRGVLYFSTASTVYRYAMRAGSLTPLGPPDVIVKDLPTGGHRARNLALSPDGGALYVNVGSPSNACQVADRSGE